MRLPIPVTTPPMEARIVEALPDGEGWQFEPKWDGFRCLAFRDGDALALQAKSGKPLARYFPEMVAALRALPLKRFVIDGELTIPIGDNLSFDALQLRLHPAESRVRKLAAETPSILVLFDCLYTEKAGNLLEKPLTERRHALEQFYAAAGAAPSLRLTDYTRDRQAAQAWLAHAGGALDGIVAKEINAPYLPGERAMLKLKHLRSADCVVGGFRYATGSKLVGSLLLGLYNSAGKLDHVGFTSGFAHEDRAALTRKLETLKGEPGFTGDAPGGPSRWSTERSVQWVPLKSKLVVEVRYDHVTGGRFRHGTKLLRWRPDKAPRQCTMDQLQEEARPRLLYAVKPRARTDDRRFAKAAGSGRVSPSKIRA
ncbi:MAG TPA: ATP-dependent DNA ligase [Stellaceae bacterium]|nr:ATP-dependent DNA ligase [Stellaceae bacterium]